MRAFALLLLASCVKPLAPTVVLEDPRGDDHGPGSYRYPADRIHAPGAYDLTKISFAVDGEEVVLKVEIRGSFAVAEGEDAAKNSNSRALPPGLRPTDEEAGGLALQNIEIYLDVDGDPTTGEHRALPGRGVSIAGGWERAIWLSPRPLRARTELERREPEMASRVVIPASVSVQGRSLEARLPISELGGAPKLDWGYTVLLTGALSDDSFGGKDGPLFVRPVLAAPGPDAFSGKDGAPPVIDLWVPPQGRPSQEDILGRESPVVPERRGDGKLVETRRATEVASQPPTSSPSGAQSQSQPAQSQPASAPADVFAEIVECRGDIITLKAPEGTLVAGRIGELLDQPGVYLVVTEVFGEIAIARALSAGARGPAAGDKVRFQGKKP